MILNQSMVSNYYRGKLSGFQGPTAFCGTEKRNFEGIPKRRSIMLECGARYPVVLAQSANDQVLHE